MNKRVVVTGGGGFIGAHLVKKLVYAGWQVSVIDNMLRGDACRFEEVARDVELHTVDVRNEEGLTKAFKGAEIVMHLAAINGTENFYNEPELVLDVGLRGALSVVNACRSANVPDLIVASSAEVYQTPSIVPTPENIALSLPDSLNPRYSYGGSKIISELIAFNYAQEHFNKVQVFRPHNIYGPDMGWKHVVPQFIVRALEIKKQLYNSNGNTTFQIQGDGTETRAFCHVYDAIEGILTMYDKGRHREIYHIGNDEEVSIRTLAEIVGKNLETDLKIQPTKAAEGGTPRRCPDISKMRSLGYQPKISLDEGIKATIEWYSRNKPKEDSNKLM